VKPFSSASSAGLGALFDLRERTSGLPSGLSELRPLNGSPGVGGVGMPMSSSRSGMNSSTSGLGERPRISASLSSPATLGSEMLGVRRLRSASVGGKMSSEFSGSCPLFWVVRKKKTLRGCTGMSSFSSGQGERGVHCRLRYWLRREERRAAGLAELSLLAMQTLSMRTTLTEQCSDLSMLVLLPVP
jgi:hypothetical protein